jgi:hypothetical protein
LKDGSYEITGDSVPIYSDKITTNANLYYDRGLHNLYAVVQEFDNDISSDLKIYSLSFPPVTAQELKSYSKGRSNNTLTIVVVLVSCAFAAGIGYLLFKKLKNRYAGEQNLIPDLPGTDNKTRAPAKPNAVYLFGDFTVRDRNNKDITYMFSAKLKQIFCLILQYSTTEDGITSHRLSEILWPDKPVAKIKNSRGVTINHLRKVLSELDGIELTYNKGCFKFVQTAAFYCDYTRCIQIISTSEAEEHREELVEILTRGKFLKLSDHPLFDSFKEATEQKLEPVLQLEMKKSFLAESYEITIHLAEAVFNIDPLNDAALIYQIKAMQRLKMNEEAQSRYQAFVIEYKNTMGKDYPHSLNKITKNFP